MKVPRRFDVQARFDRTLRRFTGAFHCNLHDRSPKAEAVRDFEHYETMPHSMKSCGKSGWTRTNREMPPAERRRFGCFASSSYQFLSTRCQGSLLASSGARLTHAECGLCVQCPAGALEECSKNFFLISGQNSFKTCASPSRLACSSSFPTLAPAVLPSG